MGNQFAVSGVTETALAALALSRGELSASSVGAGRQGAGGFYGSALIQRLSPQGGVCTLGLALAD